MSVFLGLLLSAATSATPPPIDRVAVDVMHQFGRCVAALDGRRAGELLAMDYRTDEYTKAMIQLADRNNRACMPPGGQLKFHPVLFAGALAEALLKKQKLEASSLAQRLAVDPMKTPVPVRSELDAMALCAVTKTPAESAALLGTKPMSQEEGALIQGLAPVLTDCLRKDLKVTFNRPALRSVLALTAWRIVTTPRLQ
jgi:hypothetical protein